LSPTLDALKGACGLDRERTIGARWLKATGKLMRAFFLSFSQCFFHGNLGRDVGFIDQIISEDHFGMIPALFLETSDFFRDNETQIFLN
jgi:hypothetical protein